MGTGLTVGLKLKNPYWSAPNHSATSVPFAIAVDNPIILTLFYLFILDTMTSITAPLSCPSKWISSNITNPTWRVYYLYLLLVIPSHFYGVVTIISAFFSVYKSGVKSPLSSTTDFFIVLNLGIQSFNLYFTNDFNGAMYTHFF